MSDLKYSYTFDPEEPNNTAATITKLALTGGPSVLDIGSGPAWVSRYLAAEHGRTVTCLDNDESALASLEGTGLRGFYADLEAEDWDAPIAGSSYDTVIIADVLEHLRRPGAILTKLLEEGYLKPDGRVVISVPNASHAGVVSELLVGDFRYTETGILDETHIRWFTLTSLTRLLERSGFVVERVERTLRELEQTPSGERALQLTPDVRQQMKALNPESATYQFIVLARPDNAAQRAVAEREAFEDDRRAWSQERGALLADNRRLEQELARARALLTEERTAFYTTLKEGAAELAAKQERIQALRGRVQNLRSRNAELEGHAHPASPTLTRRLRRQVGRVLRRLGVRK
jgi:SAM-dependent methyltransferase